jgi:hypothetical protein
MRTMMCVFLCVLGSAAIADETWVAKPMEGPFPSLEAYCKTLKRKPPTKADSDDGFGPWRDLCYTAADAKPKTLAAPYLEVRTFTSSAVQDNRDGTPRGGPWGVEYNLGVRLASGWYVAHDVLHDDRGNGWYCESSVHARELAVRDVIPGGAPEIVLIARSGCECKNDRYNEGLTSLVVAGMGPLGKPSAIAGVVIEQDFVVAHQEVDPPDDLPKKPKRQRLRVDWSPDGAVTLTGPVKWLGKGGPTTAPGRYVIQLP